MTKYDKKAIAVINENGIKGKIYFQEESAFSTLIYGTIIGLTPGEHGFHVHQSGDMSNGCTSMGPHFNPFNTTHGGLTSQMRHVGDLGNIVANQNGVAHINIKDHMIKLRGPCDIIGRGIVIHKNRDDMGMGGNEESLKTGNAGERIACAIIGIAN